MSSGAPLEVAAGLVFQEGRLLVCQRKKEGQFPLKWELPGGKVKEGEGCFATLQRELKEELGIEVKSAKEVFWHNHLYPDGTAVRLTFFRVDHYRGEPKNLDFQQILWAGIEELGNLDFLAGDLLLVDHVMRGEL